MTTIDIPSHVPHELVTDIDLYNVPGGDVDPQASWKAFKGKGPVVYSPMYGGFWVITEGRDIATFLRDNKRLASGRPGVAVPDHGGAPFVPLESDGPAHKQYRGNVERYFNHKKLKELEPQLRSDAKALIARVAAKGHGDFVDDVANVFPLQVFLRMMDLPIEDRHVLHEIAAVLTKSASAEAKLQAGIELGAYLAGWIQKRTENPGADPISDITKATIDGRPYNAEEIMGTVALLLAAGLDTTASVMSFMTLYLARNPEQRRYVREHRDNLTPIVNEFLRRFPVPNDSRVATEDIEYGGVTIKEGERVYLLLPLYNLDENIFENPEEVDFSRNPRHISFGTGPHTCVAAALAQLEFKIFLDEWLEQIPDFEIDPADDSVALRASHNNAIDRLKLRWDVTQT